MDGQNFNNDNFNNENFDTNPNYDNVQSSASAEQDSASANNYYYQDNTQTQQPIYAQSVPVQEAKSGSNTMSIIGLVLGILSILMTCCYGMGVALAIPGLILGIVGNKKNKSGIALAAIICSIVGLVFNVVYLVLVIIGFAAMATDPSYTELYNEIYSNM